MEKPVPKQMKKDTTRMMSFRLKAESQDLLNDYKGEGYTMSELINYAISKLPDLMGVEDDS